MKHPDRDLLKFTGLRPLQLARVLLNEIKGNPETARLTVPEIKMNAGSKTPVSILNEYLIRRGFIVKYDMMQGGVGTHNPTFMCSVEYGGYRVIGKGRSKQGAKQEAAKQMLDCLNVSCENEYQEDVKQLVLPNENNIGYNAVGELTDYCKKNCYPDATYLEVSESGPPHAKMFRVKCTVSQINTFGEGRTKKQAKHIAAHRMVVQLQTEAGEKPMEVALPNQLNDMNISNWKPPAVPKTTPVYQPVARTYNQFHMSYDDMGEKSESLKEILDNPSLITLERAPRLVQKIQKDLGVEISLDRISVSGALKNMLQSSSFEELISLEEIKLNEYKNDLRYLVNSKEIIVLSLNVNPPIVCTGHSLSEAALNILRYLEIFCS